MILFLQDGSRIALQESPEFTRDGAGNPGFERYFKFRDKPKALTFELHSENGQVRHTISDAHTLTDFFQPLPQQQPPAVGDSYDHLGILWMENSDCYTCHEEHNAMVGPSFEQIDTQYPKEGCQLCLSYPKNKRRRRRSNGGETPMNAHPELAEKEIKTILDYIFTFKPKEISDNQAARIQRNNSFIGEDVKVNPGHGAALEGVHPSYDLTILHDEDFQPRVGRAWPFCRMAAYWSVPGIRLGEFILLDGVLER